MKTLQIVRADDMGMCFGVRDALQITKEVADPTKVTIHGELVHNPTVISQLGDAGFHQVSEQQRESIPSTPLVLITAHGVSQKERRRLQEGGKQLIDTTCPLVMRVHDAAMALAAKGRHVLLIGKPGHVEVQGIVEDLESCDVVPDVASVRCYEKDSLGLVCQTTMPSEIVKEVRDEVQRLNPDCDIKFVDTVCHPTKRRQRAMLDLIGRVDAVVVVGGRNSNNTRRLAELCQKHDVPSLHVTCAAEVDAAWVKKHASRSIGLTAGTSTLDATINEVHLRLQVIAAELSGNKPTAELKGNPTSSVPPVVKK